MSISTIYSFVVENLFANFTQIEYVKTHDSHQLAVNKSKVELIFEKSLDAIEVRALFKPDTDKGKSSSNAT